MAYEDLLHQGHFTRSLTDLLQSTLERLEQTSEFRQDDPAVIELKRHIVRSIAELEIAKSAHTDHGKQPVFAGTDKAPRR